jgi:XRE family transcriptional regulator, master regulator for biofilm formation
MERELSSKEERVETTLGERLRRFRTERGLSLDELAELSGVTKAYLWKLERKPDANPSLEILQKIAGALNRPMHDFLPESSSSARGPADIPASLKEAQKRFGMTDSDLVELSSVRFRGRQPMHVDDWGVLYLHLKGAVERR